jgi:protein TonB
MFFSVMLALAWSLSSEALGQNKSVRPTVRDSSSRIVTGDVLDGIKYYIKIVPVDTTRQEKMPTYKPGAKKFSPMETVEVDKEPVPIKRVEPEYPEEARRAGMEGTVWINCLVGTDGKVKKAHVLRADAEIFIAPSIAAALQWRFFPAQLKGKPVAVWAAIPFRFKLEK